MNSTANSALGVITAGYDGQPSLSAHEGWSRQAILGTLRLIRSQPVASIHSRGNMKRILISLVVLYSTLAFGQIADDAVEARSLTKLYELHRNFNTPITIKQCLADLSSWDVNNEADDKMKLVAPNYWYQKLSTEDLVRLRDESGRCVRLALMRAGVEQASFSLAQLRMAQWEVTYGGQLYDRAEEVLQRHKLLHEFVLQTRTGGLSQTQEEVLSAWRPIYLTGEQLHNMCEHLSDDNRWDVCHGYVVAHFEALFKERDFYTVRCLQTQAVCSTIPSESQLVAIVNQFLNAHPEMWGWPAFDLVQTALLKAFPSKALYSYTRKTD